MKRILFFFPGLLAVLLLSGQQPFVATDIDNFWKAYDKITATTDSAQQYRYLKELYLDKQSPGLKSLREVRRYTDREFIDAINNYPRFWLSVRADITSAKSLYPEIRTAIAQLKKVYPSLRNATIYFAVGAFRTNGTIQQDRILIGSEMALAGNAVIIEELPAWRQPFYKEYNPRQNIALLCAHEYIHTQQKPLVENLLSKCLYEGVAEFVSCLATGKPSNSPAIAFGKANHQRVTDQFVKDLFTMSNDYNWLWGENRNDLRVRDLGYYIGYTICERYYNLSADKRKAIAELIELDYTDEKQVERIVDTTGLLPASLQELYTRYEAQRPTVTGIFPFENGSRNVKPGLTKITISFSEPLNGYNTGIDYGPLGDNFIPVISRERTWSADHRSWTFEADLQPGKRYQVLISNNFRKEDGVRLKPYLIDITVSE